MADEGRELPLFDNHYSNQTLVDTWWESRWCHDPLTGSRLPLSLSGVSAAQYQQDQLRWGPRQNTTYQDDFSRRGWSIPTLPTAMTRPHGLGKELLLSTGENMHIRGPPTSWDYGAQYRSSSLELSPDADGVGGTGARFASLPLIGIGKRERLLHAATASANPESPRTTHTKTPHGNAAEGLATTTSLAKDHSPATLYDCLHGPAATPSNSALLRQLHFGGSNAVRRDGAGKGVVEEIPVGSKGPLPRTLADPSGLLGQLNPITAEALPDYRRWSRYFTTRQAGDLPVEHFSFQKVLPPPTRSS